MQDHLDLQGASGATYRFRLIAGPDQLPATSGNFVYVRWLDTEPQVLCCGVIDSLSAAFGSWDEAVRTYGPSSAYIRLNVARARRDEEHADLVENYRPPMSVCAEA